MAGIEEDEEPTLPIVCYATGQPIPVKDADAHGVLFVFMATHETPYGAGVLAAALAKSNMGTAGANAIVNGAITKDAKTIRLTLHRDKPGGELYGYSYQTVETFEGITAGKDESEYPHGS